MEKNEYYNYVNEKENKVNNIFTFNKFSLQWVTVITFFPFLVLLKLKNRNLLIKISNYGVYLYTCMLCISYIYFVRTGKIFFKVAKIVKR